MVQRPRALPTGAGRQHRLPAPGKELLAADPARFAAAIAEIDRTLQERAEELLRTRERTAACCAPVP